MRRAARGFTLIELLVVVTLIGIMIAIAVPSFAQFISSYRATTAINDLLQAVTQTRTEALKRGHKVILLPRLNSTTTIYSSSGNWQNGWAVFQSIAGTSTYDSTSATNMPVALHGAVPASITVTGSTELPATPFNGANDVAFDGTGYLSTNTPAIRGGIVITDQTGSARSVRTLCLSNYGRPRIAPVPAGGATQVASSCQSG